MVLNEFFAALGSGRFMLALIVCVGGGLALGGSVRTAGGKIGWTLVLIVVVVGLLVTSIPVQVLLRASETGTLPRGFFSDFVILTVSICAVLFFGTMLVAGFIAANREAEERASVEAMTPDELLRELNIIAAHPAVAQGWFGDRWKPMSDQDRLSWVASNIGPLRELRLLGGENGFAAHDLNLPAFLAEIDQRRRP